MADKWIYFCFLLVYNIIFSQNIQVPIFAFHGVPPGKYSTKEQFLTMKKAGINICYTVYNNDQEALDALDAAQLAGTKLVIRVPSLFSETEKAVTLFKKHPALYGYYVADEPVPNEFDNVLKLVKKIKSYDDKHIVYVNLFPNYVGREVINGLSYRDYLAEFLNKVPVDFLSFDHYPIINNILRGDWYSNLEDIRDSSKKNKIPFWAFACSTIHYNYAQPTLAGIKLQQLGNLLYGAQGLQYFAYWTLTYEYNWVKEKYGFSIVDDKGNPTPTYNIVKTVNEQIQRVAWVFAGAQSDEVYHMGDEIPLGTTKLNATPKPFRFFSTYGKNALVSFLSNGRKKFVIVQNKSLTEDITLEYKLKSSLSKVNNDSGKIISLLTSKKYTETILPGDILIFTYDK
ncbi:hypothetical protein D1631_07010 [Chryseobacterium nematophagum]|uniref:Glycoside hydrolase family 42 N-terminal domain-containing protein n=1 Tax=Chryseobacterium nematophagum TaxID=2305228 RepID=A0A3M7TF36_9FLAO|nr:hypothetical protein [Chryseobacterium nematophagum]RNA61694.1 hypothetical protein D1631_07010 [Chryseobacterium nematophagum]